MRYARLVLTTAAVWTIAACVQRQTEVDTGSVLIDSRWTATLAPNVRDSGAITGAASVSLGGRGSMLPGNSSTETKALLSLYGASPGSSYAWHIHLGTCGDDRGIIGSPELYPLATADENGRADMTATLPFSTPRAGEFYVDVHASSSAASRPVACGSLAAAS
jgi:hypothetical protein